MIYDNHVTRPTPVSRYDRCVTYDTYQTVTPDTWLLTSSRSTFVIDLWVLLLLPYELRLPTVVSFGRYYYKEL